MPSGRVDLARDETDSPHLEKTAGALDRTAVLIDDLLTLARQGAAVDGPEPVSRRACREVLRPVDTAEGPLTVETDRVVSADSESGGTRFEFGNVHVVE